MRERFFAGDSENDSEFEAGDCETREPRASSIIQNRSEIDLQVEAESCKFGQAMPTREKAVSKRAHPKKGRPEKLVPRVESNVSALRTVRQRWVELALELAEKRDSIGVLILPQPAISRKTLQEEWKNAERVLQPDLSGRLLFWVPLDKTRDIASYGIPHEPDAGTRARLRKRVRKEQVPARSTATQTYFVILKLLLHEWLKHRKPVSAIWLQRKSGYTYPPVQRALKRLGTLVERKSKQGVTLRWFPRDEFLRMAASAFRNTVRFVDPSGKPRSIESHVRRLESTSDSRVAIGGVLGARHYYPDLDIIGTPRLDLSLLATQVRTKRDLEEQVEQFARKLDPALQRTDDPLAEPAVVVHVVPHRDSLFREREPSLFWADPVDCLLDLFEARLDLQAEQFVRSLEEGRAMTA